MNQPVLACPPYLSGLLDEWQLSRGLAAGEGPNRVDIGGETPLC